MSGTLTIDDIDYSNKVGTLKTDIEEYEDDPYKRITVLDATTPFTDNTFDGDILTDTDNFYIGGDTSTRCFSDAYYYTCWDSTVGNVTDISFNLPGILEFETQTSNSRTIWTSPMPGTQVFFPEDGTRVSVLVNDLALLTNFAVIFTRNQTGDLTGAWMDDDPGLCTTGESCIFRFDDTTGLSVSYPVNATAGYTAYDYGGNSNLGSGSAVITFEFILRVANEVRVWIDDTIRFRQDLSGYNPTIQLDTWINTRYNGEERIGFNTNSTGLKVKILSSQDRQYPKYSGLCNKF